MPCEAGAFYLAKDLSLESEYDGNAKIYWSPSSSWRKLDGTIGFAVALNLMDPVGNCKVSVVYQGSVDGLSWNDPITPSPDIEVTAAARTTTERAYPVDSTLWLPFVRFGLVVAEDGTPASLVQGRVTAVVTPILALDRGYTGEFATELSLTSSDLGSQVGNIVDVSNASSGFVSISVSDAQSGDDINVKLYTSNDQNQWFDTGVSSINVTFSSPNGSGYVASTRQYYWNGTAEVERTVAMGKYLQLFLVIGGTINATIAMSASVFLRNQ